MKSRRRRPQGNKARNGDTSIAKMVTVYSYDDFIKHTEEHPTWTPAFYLKKNIDLFLIVLHSAFTSDGKVKPSAQEILDKVNTYVEAVPPNGLRLYIRGRLPKETEQNYNLGGGVRLELIKVRSNGKLHQLDLINYWRTW